MSLLRIVKKRKEHEIRIAKNKIEKRITMKLKEGIIDKTFIASNRDEYFKIRGGRNNNMNEISSIVFGGLNMENK